MHAMHATILIHVKSVTTFQFTSVGIGIYCFTKFIFIMIFDFYKSMVIIYGNNLW